MPSGSSAALIAHDVHRIGPALRDEELAPGCADAVLTGQRAAASASRNTVTAQMVRTGAGR
jgi:hypothetical protein